MSKMESSIFCNYHFSRVKEKTSQNQAFPGFWDGSQHFHFSSVLIARPYQHLQYLTSQTQYLYYRHIEAFILIFLLKYSSYLSFLCDRCNGIDIFLLEYFTWKMSWYCLLCTAGWNTQLLMVLSNCGLYGNIVQHFLAICAILRSLL